MVNFILTILATLIGLKLYNIAQDYFETKHLESEYSFILEGDKDGYVTVISNNKLPALIYKRVIQKNIEIAVELEHYETADKFSKRLTEIEKFEDSKEI